MKVFRIEESFGLDHLRLVDLPTPEPGPGEVRLRVQAVSLNYRDRMMVDGSYNPRQPLPLVPCSDACGIVDAIGPGASRFSVGDRAMPIFAQRWVAGPPQRERLRSTLGGPLSGTLAESIVLSEQGLVHAPSHLDAVEASTLPCAGLTAWGALVTHGGLQPGQTVLVLGTGGVAVFAIQIARMAGARVIVTSSSDDKLARAMKLGASAGVNYQREPRWGRAVRALTEDGEGVDHVLEVGGAGTLPETLEAVRVGGSISLIGVLSGAVAPLSIVPLFMKQVRLQGLLVGSRDGLERMSAAFAEHRVHPVVDRIFPFERSVDAFRYLSEGTHFGKVAISLDVS